MVYLILVLMLLGCNYSPTPIKYINTFTVNNDVYNRTKSDVLDTLYLWENNYHYPFESGHYINCKIFIDTILYSPGVDKFVFIAIIENKKVNSFNDDSSICYDAFCFGGYFLTNFKINFFRGTNIAYIDRPTLKKASEDFRFFYFNQLRLFDEYGENSYKYNVDDKRFWNGPFWEFLYDYNKNFEKFR